MRDFCVVVLPVLQILAVFWSWRTVQYKVYPAFLLWLAAEAANGIATLFHYDIWYTAPAFLLIRYWLTLEVLRFSCLTCRILRYHMFLWSVSCSILLMSMTRMTLTPWELYNLFSHYFHILLAFILVVAYTLRLRRPVIENFDTYCYRFLITLSMIRVAASKSFVKGGLGYLFFDFNSGATVHEAVDVISRVLAILIVMALVYSMTTSYSSRRDNFYKKAASA